LICRTKRKKEDWPFRSIWNN